MTDDTPSFYFGPTSHVLRVSLNDLEPEIWRRVRVPSNLELGEFSRILMVAMGWVGRHRHELEIAGIRFGQNDDDKKQIDELGITVEQILTSTEAKAVWRYDFGDGWEHQVIVEAIEPNESGAAAQVLDGACACPPEDSGGPTGYLDKLRVVADPDDEDHDFIVEWMPDNFDPAHFDLAQANANLRRL